MIAAVVVHGLTGKCWMFYGYKANTLTPLEERRQGREKPNPSFSCWLHPAKPPSKDLNQKWGWVLGAGVELDTDTNGPAHETDNSTTAGWLFILSAKLPVRVLIFRHSTVLSPSAVLLLSSLAFFPFPSL